MDKATLVKSDIDITALILDALSQTKIRFTFCDWRYVPQLEEWQLVIATLWVEEKGPRTTYRAVIDALTKAGVYDDAPMRRIFLMSPNDPVVQELEKEARTRNEGFVHILRHNGSRNKEEYSVLFAPIAGIGGPVPSKHFTSHDALREFLTERLHLRPTAIDDAMRELSDSGHASIYPVRLTTREIKKFGLA